MKYKSEKGFSLITFVVFITIFLISIYGINTSGIYDPNISSTSYFSTFKILMALGTSFLFLGFSMPKKIYQTNGKDFKFGHFKIVWFVRIIISTLGYIIYILGSKMGKVVWLEGMNGLLIMIEISFLLFLFLFVIIWAINIIKNRNDYLKISDSKIEYFDDDSGNLILPLEEIRKIKLHFESYTSSRGTSSDSLKKINIELKNSDTVVIDLEKMNLLGFDDIIKDTFNLKYSHLL